MSEVSNKRFVHFDGTKQEFIDGGYPDQYQESIVFINGDGNESNNTIYTHGEYYGQGVIVKGDASNSAVLKNGNNKALSEYDVAIGMNTISGLRGWYYKAMSISNTGYVYLYLSSNQQLPSFVASANEVEQENDIVCDLKEGDVCCIINGNRFINVFKVKYNHIKQYGRIGFSYIGEGDNPINGIITTEEINKGNLSLDDYCIYCLDRPDIGNINISEAALTEGKLTKSLNSYTHAEGLRSVAYGKTSHVEGQDNIASGECSHAEGAFTKSKGDASHTEGFNTEASQLSAHAEGYGTLASNGASHAEGSATKATGLHSHAEGDTTLASGSQSHAEGKITFATGEHSHAEGHWTKAQGKSSHAEGQGISIDKPNLSEGDYSHTEGYSTHAQGNCSHAEGAYTIAIGNRTHAEGNETKAIGSASHAEGYLTSAYGANSYAGGRETLAFAECSHAEGKRTLTGSYTIDSSGNYIFDEKSGSYAHAEGENTIAEGKRSHAEGNTTKALGESSHAEGFSTVASGVSAHAGGKYTIASGEGSIASGCGLKDHYITSSGKGSFASGYCTEAQNTGEFACGKFNTSTSGKTLFSVGCGTSNDDRKNIIEVRGTDIILYYNEEDGFVKLSDLLKKKLITVYDNDGNIKIDPYDIKNINSLGRMLIDKKYTENNIFVLSFSFSYEYKYGEWSDENYKGCIDGTIYIPIECDKTASIISLQYNCIGDYIDSNIDNQTDTISIDINACCIENQLYITESVYSNKNGVLMNPITNFELSSYSDIPILLYGSNPVYNGNYDYIDQDTGYIGFKNVYRLPDNTQDVYVTYADEHTVKRLNNSPGVDLLLFEKFTGSRCDVVVIDERKPDTVQDSYGAEGIIVYYNDGTSIFCPINRTYVFYWGSGIYYNVDYINFNSLKNLVPALSVSLMGKKYKAMPSDIPFGSVEKIELWFDEAWPLFATNVTKLDTDVAPERVTIRYYGTNYRGEEEYEGTPDVDWNTYLMHNDSSSRPDSGDGWLFVKDNYGDIYIATAENIKHKFSVTDYE